MPDALVPPEEAAALGDGTALPAGAEPPVAADPAADAPAAVGSADAGTADPLVGTTDAGAEGDSDLAADGWLVEDPGDPLAALEPQATTANASTITPTN